MVNNRSEELGVALVDLRNAPPFPALDETVAQGGEQSAPLGRAVIGGLFVATGATLLILPAVFSVVMGGASTASASLHPDDPDGGYYAPQSSAGASHPHDRGHTTSSVSHDSGTPPAANVQPNIDPHSPADERGEPL